MTGKDWFILATRLLGLVFLYFGFQEALAYVVRDMLFANVDPLYYPQLASSWSRLVHGGANVAIALLALTKAERFADWCYGKESQTAMVRDVEENAQGAFGRKTTPSDDADPIDKNYP
jgi:hypothetical protein